MSFSYPFSAVVGQEAFKLALLLAAIDPAIGGVLVRGPRGVAKTTLARALAELTPGRFVELPLGATEERVTGTLDLAGALREGKVEFAPGLLARAHDGVLYVDEVNLLPDAIVDVLLDAAASGVNVVERDGVSHRHPARFVLVGTMNPDEGELRPQLIDRFGLAVNASATLGPAERAEIVLRRLDFDRDPEAFIARHADAQRALIERCAAARARAQGIPLGGDALALVSERCFAAGVEGVRADLAMLRAARAHAAWHGRTHITEADIEAVAELALSHRRTREREPEDDGGTSGPSGAPRSGAGTSARGASAHRTSPHEGHSSARSPESTGQGDRGALPAVPVRSLRIAALPSWLSAPKPQASRLRSSPLQHRVRQKLKPQHSRSIDWFATLARSRSRRTQERTHAAPAESLAVESRLAPAGTPLCSHRDDEVVTHARSLRPPERSHAVPFESHAADSGSFRVAAAGTPLCSHRDDEVVTHARSLREPGLADQRVAPFSALRGAALSLAVSDLRYRRRPMTRVLTVLALDCSASMLRGGALAAAKGVARVLLTAPGSARSELALIAFSGAQASACIARASGPRLERAVVQLGAGGGTPLRRALLDALALGRRAEQRGATSKRLLLFTDGRTHEQARDLQPLCDAFDVSVIDCERTRVRLGRARTIAEQLSARYVHIDSFL